MAKHRKRASQSTMLVWATRVTLLVVAVGGWEYFAAHERIDPFFWGQPTGIWDYLWSWASNGNLQRDLTATLQEALYGLAIGGFGGVVVGVFLGLSAFWGRVFSPLVDMANSTPRFALAPLFVLWLGLGISSKVGVVVSIVVFIMIINTIEGVHAVDRDHIRLLRVLGATKADQIRYVVLPASVVWIKAGLRLAIPYAIAGAVIGEFVAADRGVGYRLVQQAGNLNTNGVLAAVIVLSILGTTFSLMSSWLLSDHRQRSRLRTAEVAVVDSGEPGIAAPRSRTDDQGGDRRFVGGHQRRPHHERSLETP